MDLSVARALGAFLEDPARGGLGPAAVYPPAPPIAYMSTY